MNDDGWIGLHVAFFPPMSVLLSPSSSHVDCVANTKMEERWSNKCIQKKDEEIDDLLDREICCRNRVVSKQPLKKWRHMGKSEWNEMFSHINTPVNPSTPPSYHCWLLSCIPTHHSAQQCQQKLAIWTVTADKLFADHQGKLWHRLGPGIHLLLLLWWIVSQTSLYMLLVMHFKGQMWAMNVTHIIPHIFALDLGL